MLLYHFATGLFLMEIQKYSKYLTWFYKVIMSNGSKIWNKKINACDVTFKMPYHTILLNSPTWS